MLKIKWNREMDAYRIAQWVDLGSNVKLTLTHRIGVREDAFQYSLEWGDGTILSCHWKENLTAENWTQAKAKAVMRTRHIIASYLRELQDAMGDLSEVILNEEENCSVG